MSRDDGFELSLLSQESWTTSWDSLLNNYTYSLTLCQETRDFQQQRLARYQTRYENGLVSASFLPLSRSAR